MFAKKIDPYTVDTIQLIHSVGQHTVIHFKLKNGRDVLYGAGDNIPFNPLPFKDHSSSSLIFSELDTSALESKPIQKVFCSFKQTIIITSKST